MDEDGNLGDLPPEVETIEKRRSLFSLRILKPEAGSTA